MSCNCGCDSCGNVGNIGVVLNESIVKRDILSENLRYHVQNQLPLTENTFRYGSDSFLNLWAEARALYLREIIHVNEDDIEILTETNIGNFGVLEDGTKVPLDLPMLNEQMDIYDDIANSEFGMDYDQLGSNEQEWVRDEIDNMSINEAKEKFKVIDTKTGDIIDSDLPKDIAQKLAKKKKEWTSYPDRKESAIAKIAQTLDEAKDKPLNKPMRDSSGGKAYKVYVKDPKTNKIKTVRFGSGGLRAKINDKKARNAFAKRHKCSEKTDKTKASYWSCRLPRYAKLLGLKSTFTGFW